MNVILETNTRLANYYTNIILSSLLYYLYFAKGQFLVALRNDFIHCTLQSNIE